MQLREAIKVLDSDAHARDFDSEIKPYLPEPYRNQKAALIPSEHYDRNLGGTLGRAATKVEERLEAMDTQEIDTAVMFPTSDPAWVGCNNRMTCSAFSGFAASFSAMLLASSASLGSSVHPSRERIFAQAALPASPAAPLPASRARTVTAAVIVASVTGSMLRMRRARCPACQRTPG